MDYSTTAIYQNFLLGDKQTLSSLNYVNVSVDFTSYDVMKQTLSSLDYEVEGNFISYSNMYKTIMNLTSEEFLPDTTIIESYRIFPILGTNIIRVSEIK